MGANNKRKTLKEVKEYFKSQGCKLLERKYLSAQTKMKYRCSCGKESNAFSTTTTPFIILKII
jgi:hypothetical protein